MRNLHSIPKEVMPQRLFWSNEPHPDCTAYDEYSHYRCAERALNERVIYMCEHRCNIIHRNIHYFAFKGGVGFCDRCRNDNCPY